MAATLRDHGLPADVVDRGHAADVVVPAARREEALATMASRMDEIRDRVGREDDAADDAEHLEASRPGPRLRRHDDEPAPGARPLVTERLRRLWPVPVLLVPLLVLLGAGSLPANLAVVVLLAGMVAVVALRQRRRR